MKKKFPCACGCNENFPINRMEIATIQGGRYFVHVRHRNRLSREINMSARLANKVSLLSYMPFWKRWAHADDIFNAQVAIRTRTAGEAEAKRHARASWWLLVLPQPLTLFFIARAREIREVWQALGSK